MRAGASSAGAGTQAPSDGLSAASALCGYRSLRREDPGDSIPVQPRILTPCATKKNEALGRDMRAQMRTVKYKSWCLSWKVE